MNLVTKTIIQSNKKLDQRRVNIRLIGAEQQKTIPTDELVSILKSIPSFHLEGLKAIEFDPARIRQKSVGYFLPPRVPTPLPNLKSHAEYLQEKQTIMIYEYTTKSELLHILFHELGHHVYHRALESSQKKSWVTQIHPHNRHTTDYGARNASEDFAETYALYVLQPEKLYQLTEKYTFMRNIAFKGERPQIVH